jgi:hypothetical protein
VIRLFEGNSLTTLRDLAQESRNSPRASCARSIAKLGKNAVKESVKLAALRAVFSDMMAVSKFAGLEDRVTELEEQFGDRTGNTSRPD